MGYVWGTTLALVGEGNMQHPWVKAEVPRGHRPQRGSKKQEIWVKRTGVLLPSRAPWLIRQPGKEAAGHL